MKQLPAVLTLMVRGRLLALLLLPSLTLASPAPALLLDFTLPGMNGLQLQQKLKQLRVALPIIMMSGHADVRIAVQAMSNGALTFLEKPCCIDELFGHIRSAIQRDVENRLGALQRSHAAQHISQLTDKEREILNLIASGKSNKQMAAELNLSLRAVEDRRSRLMKKLQVRSVAELMTIIQSAAAVL